MTAHTIKLLVVEDSMVQRDLIISILDANPLFQVVGYAENGLEALDELDSILPDMVLMDLHMPKMNGIEAIRCIMKKNPLPIIAMSASVGADDVINSFHALEAGAVAFVEKPRSRQNANFKWLSSHMLNTLFQLSQANVRTVERAKSQGGRVPHSIAKTIILKDIRLIAIGVSTGGPLVLQTILTLLPLDFPPILIVQHIAAGFIEGMSHWLTRATNHPITVAEEGQMPERGHVYLAPSHVQMGISHQGTIQLKKDSAKPELCPSIDFLFRSVAEALKEKALGIILTGMGCDGAKELKTMKDNGAITIAQSKETSLIYGMPGRAVELGAAKYVLSPEQIAEMIAAISGGKGFK